MDLDAPFMCISDLQIPYEAEKALEFCFYIKKHYKIPDENIINVGDELDLHAASLYPKGGDFTHTPNDEIKISREKIKEWSKVFPKMKLCTSNHGLRWIRKAVQAEIPSQALRSYKEIYEMPEHWHWKDEWRIHTKHPFRIIHGQGFSGINGARNAAIDGGISTVIGHIHSHASINYIRTDGLKIFSMNVGCLIDTEAYAFSYGKYNRTKPCLGVGIVANNGMTPIWLPYEILRR